MAFPRLFRPHVPVFLLTAGILAACSSDSEGPHGDGDSDANTMNSGNGGSSRGGASTTGSGGRAGATGGAGGIKSTGGGYATGGSTLASGGIASTMDSGSDSSMDASADAADGDDSTDAGTADASVASGGMTGSGGATASTGGASSTGGAPSTGGTSSSGGTTATGGVTSTGGTSATGGATQSPTRLDVTTPSVLTTELGTTNTINVTLTGSSGFAGAVALNATVLDGSNAPLSGWTFSIDTPNVVLPQNGSTTVHLTVNIPTENKGLAATATVTATSAATSGTWSTATDITVQNQYTIKMDVTAGPTPACVYPPAGTTSITVGTKIRWLNVSTSNNITIHSNGALSGCPHQADPGSVPGTAYECTITQVTSSFTWYCHAPGPTVNTLRIAPVL